MTKLSIIIPILNEADTIPRTLRALQPLRAKGHELIVVDGGSKDASLRQSQSLADRIIESSTGRSRQMNSGAQVASGEVLLFLHADTFLPQGADQLILSRMRQSGKAWGRFDVRLSGKNLLFRMIECLMNWRSRLSGIATGDQGIFVSDRLFQSIGGFPEIDLMEDVALCKVLKRFGPPLCLWQRVETSSRRWEENGTFRTIFLMWYLRLAYCLGTPPGKLIKSYGRLKSS